jgi:hypothetical protein
MTIETCVLPNLLSLVRTARILGDNDISVTHNVADVDYEEKSTAYAKRPNALKNASYLNPFRASLAAPR